MLGNAAVAPPVLSHRAVDELTQLTHCPVTVERDLEAYSQKVLRVDRPRGFPTACWEEVPTEDEEDMALEELLSAEEAWQEAWQKTVWRD